MKPATELVRTASGRLQPVSSWLELRQVILRYDLLTGSVAYKDIYQRAMGRPMYGPPSVHEVAAG
jgi:hypothetical protein